MVKTILFLFVCVSTLFSFNIEKINTFQADFSQSIINPSGKEIIYKGKVYIKKPFNVLWKYNDPIQKDVYLINDHVTIIEPDLEQAILSTLDKEINILHILQNGKQIAKNKYESILYNKPYIFSINNDKLTTIEYKDDVDNKIVIKFTHIVQNQPIEDSLYNFHIPHEYDIIRK